VFLGLKLGLGLDERMRSVGTLLRVCRELILSSLFLFEFEFADILDLGRRFAIVMLLLLVRSV
jgi:hypothetical protein